MKKITLSILLLMTICFAGQAQDYSKRILTDMVRISNNKMMADDYNLIKKTDGTTMQVKCYGEAPAAGVISRDNFVALFTELTVSMIEEMTKADDGATSQDLESIIGNPDMEINVFVAKAGIQVEVKGANGTTRNTVKWEELFK